MQILPWVVVAAALMAGATQGELPPPERPYKVLMLLPVSSKSHRNVFMPIAEALADRGHKVVMLTNHGKSSKNPNVLELQHGLPHFREEKHNMFEMNQKGSGGLGFFKKILPAMARDLFHDPVVQDLYRRRKEFDLIILNHMFNEPIYPFLHEMPFITVATPGMDPRQSAVLGNPLNPAYSPNFIQEYPIPMTFWQRWINTYFHVFVGFYWRHWGIVPDIQKEISEQFPDLPSLLELEANQSLALLNTHFSISQPVPLLPSQVEVGAMHCRPARPLPQDLESWVSGAGPEGVIYFSLGSYTKGTSMPEKYRDVFIEAFRTLPQRVIWKYEGEVKNKPDNVMTVSWLPQQDILAHEKVKVFISHGGLLSLQESIYHSTPLLVLPIYGDQPKNALTVKNSGFGATFKWEEINVDLVVSTLSEVINNPRYQENVAAASRVLRDQITTPVDRAVYWTEYVVRHGGAPHLRCPGTLLSWTEFLNIDLLVVLVLAAHLIIYLILRLLRFLIKVLFGSSSLEKKKKRE